MGLGGLRLGMCMLCGGGGATDVSPREGGVGWKKGGTHEQRWPGNTDSLKSYFDFEASEWVAAEGPVPSLSVWLGKVPTSHELYLRKKLLREQNFTVGWLRRTYKATSRPLMRHTQVSRDYP